MTKKPKHPLHKPAQGAWHPESPYHDLQVAAHRDKKVYRHSDGTVILPNTSMLSMAELDRFLDKRFDVQQILAEFSRSQEEQGFDSIEDFYDFGPPDDHWDDMEPPGQLFDEMPHSAAWEEDAAVREYLSSKQKGAGRPSKVVEEAAPAAPEPTPSDPDPEGAGTFDSQST